MVAAARRHLPKEITLTTWRRFFDPYEPVHALVAERGADLVALAHYLFHRNTLMPAGTCYLQDLFTSEAARGKGGRPQTNPDWFTSRRRVQEQRASTGIRTKRTLSRWPSTTKSRPGPGLLYIVRTFERRTTSRPLLALACLPDGSGRQP